jgi:ketosteroid isomerase-like protein
MSQANVEIVRRGYEEFNRSKKLVADAFDPDVEWHTAEDLPDSATHHGIAGVEKLFADWSGSFEDFRAEIEETIDGGDEVVVVVIELHGRIKGSDQEVLLPETHVWRLRDGKVFEIREYRTKAQALEAAGLSD